MSIFFDQMNFIVDCFGLDLYILYKNGSKLCVLSFVIVGCLVFQEMIIKLDCLNICHPPIRSWIYQFCLIKRFRKDKKNIDKISLMDY